jgi:hypothetical protein
MMAALIVFAVALATFVCSYVVGLVLVKLFGW